MKEHPLYKVVDNPYTWLHYPSLAGRYFYEKPANVLFCFVLEV